MAEPIVILQISFGNTEYMPIPEKTTGPQQMATKRTQYGVTRFWLVRENSHDRFGRYLIIKQVKRKLNNLIHINYYIALF